MASITRTAHAKINLYLHITGKRDDGYHTLDSLFAFADIGDEITLIPSNSFEFQITGPFAAGLSTNNNLVIEAARKLADFVQKDLNCTITLTKNLPVAAGLGGGSADAAATIHTLLEYWDIPASTLDLVPLLELLGADVPACFYAPTPVHVTGIGEKITPAPAMPKLHAVLINPGIECSTKEVFSMLEISSLNPKEDIEESTDFIEGLKSQCNDLTRAAIKICPAIKEVLDTLEKEENCVLARLSGSGATCFGLFKDEQSAQSAAKTLSTTHPNWWVKSCRF